MLHIIKDFPLPSAILSKAQSGDTLILTENAVFAAKQENMANQSLAKKTLSHINLYVRKADLILKNISQTELFRGVIIIDDVQYENVLTEDSAIKSYN